MGRGRVFHVNAIEAEEIEGDKVVFALDSHRNECAFFTIDFARVADLSKSGKWAIVRDQSIHKSEDPWIIVLKIYQRSSHTRTFTSSVLEREVGHHIEAKLKDGEENCDQ